MEFGKVSVTMGQVICIGLFFYRVVRIMEVRRENVLVLFAVSIIIFFCISTSNASVSKQFFVCPFVDRQNSENINT